MVRLPSWGCISMSFTSKIIMLGAAGSGGAIEFVRIGEGTQGTYNYNQYINAVLRPDTGELIVHRDRRSSVGSEHYLEKYTPELEYVSGDNAYFMNNSGNISRNYYGSPKWSSDPAYGYDVLGGDGSTYAGPAKYADFSSGTVKQQNVGYLYNTNNYIGRLTRAYNIGDRTYVVNSAQSYGGAVGSFKHTATSGSTSATQPTNPGHQNTYNTQFFIDVQPVDPTSQSTNHIAIHSSNYHTSFYTLNSSLQMTGNGWQIGSGSVLQYWSNMCIDSSSNTAWAYDVNNKYLHRYNYSTNTLTSYEINYPGSGNPTGVSCYLALINGYLYLQSPHRSYGMYVIKINPSNPTSGVQSKLFSDTSGYGAPSNNYIGNQDGFLIEGPNEFHGTTDLMYIGFSNYTNNSGNFMRTNMAVCTWDNLSQIANYNSTLSVANSTVSLTQQSLGGSSQSSLGGSLYSASSINAPNTNGPAFYLTGPDGLNVNTISEI